MGARISAWAAARISAWAAALALVSAAFSASAAASPPTLGPVPARVLVDVRSFFVQHNVHRIHEPNVSAQAAARTAGRLERRIGPPNGVSLARATKAGDPTDPGRVVWLVSFHVVHGFLHHGGRRGPLGNYLVVAIDVYTGRYVDAAGGYDPKLNNRHH